jgi:4-amino-4-deoxy-L-arabinose transferase-like glycosyltransferase
MQHMGRSTIEIERLASAGSKPRRLGALVAARAWIGATGTYARTLAGITALAWAGRVALLGSWPRFWGDEAFTGVQVRKPFFAMLDVVRKDSHPPLLYLLQSIIGAFSTSPGALRLVSALAGTAAVPLAAALGRRVGGDRAGLLAAGLLASFPGFVLSSRDARGYALAMALVLAGSLALWRAAEEPSRRRLFLYGACVSAAVYTHYFAIVAVTAQVLVALWVFKPSPATARRMLAAFFVGGLTLVPWLVVASAQFQHAGAPFWVAPIQLGSLFSDLVTRLGRTSGEELTTVATWIGEAAVIPLLVLLYRRVDPPRRRGVLFLLLCSLAPTVAVLLISLYKPVYDTRFVLIFWGPGEAVVGASLAALGRPMIGPLVCVALAAASVFGLLQVQRPDFAAVVTPLNGRVQGGDVVALNGPDHYFSIAYAGDAATQKALLVVGDNIPWYFGTAGYPPGTQVHSIPAVSGRVYVVGDAGMKLPPVPAGFVHQSRSCHDGVCVDGFGR